VGEVSESPDRTLRVRRVSAVEPRRVTPEPVPDPVKKKTKGKKKPKEIPTLVEHIYKSVAGPL